VDRLFAEGAAIVGTDPDPSTARAVRAYEKAGFTATAVQDTLLDSGDRAACTVADPFI
jgi:hypothetical protein